MQNRTKYERRRIDVACGYALGGYIGVALIWIAILANPNSVLYALLISGIAGFFGVVRSFRGVPKRILITALASSAYTFIAITFLYYNAALEAAGIGIFFSAAFAYPIYQAFRYDFANTTPPWLCQDCAYPLLGVQVPTCPECGKPFDPETVPKVSKESSSGAGPL
ncbi:MAG: hypothetical protein KTR15_06975 [Phycisphaeraceae bacterium]|nr:hypothetical protein [Phycisphaeraceae bacterium]